MPKKKPIDELRNITRLDYFPQKAGAGATIGWWVRVMRGKERHSKFFSDGKYGGKEKALEEAKRCRDEIIKKHDSLLGKGYQSFMTVKNKSGIVGVNRGVKSKTKPNRKTYSYDVWNAGWIDPDSGKGKNRSFGINKHGEAGALRKAILAREEAIAYISGSKKISTSKWGQYSIRELVAVVENSQSSNDKGRALEELIIRFFSGIPGLSINNIRVKTETEEIDIVLLNNSGDPRYRRESVFLLVECKNWSSKIGKNELVLFKEKIENRSSRCTLGFLISWNGFAETVTKEMLRGSREEVLVVPIGGEEIKRAIETSDFEKALTDSFDKAVSL